MIVSIKEEMMSKTNNEHCDCGCNKNAKCNHKNEKKVENNYKKQENDANKHLNELKKELQEANETIEDLTKNFIEAENLSKSLNISCVELKKDIERIKERNKNIIEEANDNAVINVAKDFLPILDNFEAALKLVKDNEITHGFELIYNQTRTMLKNMGVDEIASVGEKFNPELHNAIMKEPAKNEGDSGKVACEYQKGYKYKDRIIRYCTVSIYE